MAQLILQFSFSFYFGPSTSHFFFKWHHFHLSRKFFRTVIWCGFSHFNTPPIPNFDANQSMHNELLKNLLWEEKTFINFNVFTNLMLRGMDSFRYNWHRGFSLGREMVTIRVTVNEDVALQIWQVLRDQGEGFVLASVLRYGFSNFNSTKLTTRTCNRSPMVLLSAKVLLGESTRSRK